MIFLLIIYKYHLWDLQVTMMVCFVLGFFVLYCCCFFGRGGSVYVTLWYTNGLPRSESCSESIIMMKMYWILLKMSRFRQQLDKKKYAAWLWYNICKLMWLVCFYFIFLPWCNLCELCHLWTIFRITLLHFWICSTEITASLLQQLLQSLKSCPMRLFWIIFDEWF